MSTTRDVLGENRFYMAPPTRKFQQEREKKRKRLEAKEEKRKAKKLRDDLLITNSSNSVREYSDPIPADILIDILSRVPTKSIGRFRCVSKSWKSILRRPDFTELFLTRSSTSLRLFFSVRELFDKNKELLVFSSPQPQNPNNNSALVATRYKSFPKRFPNGFLEICNSLCGFVFLQSWRTKQRVICNPVTGEFIALPSLPKVTGNYFGFDPINKQLKVLSLTKSRYGRPNSHRVLTLGTGKRKWKTIQEDQDPLVPHDPARDGICINGVLYYIARFDEGYDYKIVCFDFRYEKFSIIKMDEDMLINQVTGLNLLLALSLFNNKGKLSVYQYIEMGNEKLALWVLEDAGKHIWSKRLCLLPPFCNNISENQRYKIVGVTGTGEFVFTPYLLSNPFYIFYYNTERNTFTRFNIHGFEKFNWDRPVIDTVVDYVESVQGFIT